MRYIYVCAQVCLYPYIKNKSILYLRYIDDIFMIWTGTKQELLIFLEKLNSKHKTIKFEHNVSNSNISFLNTLIYKDKNNTIQTTLYRKPTDQQSYLHAHSKSLKKSIPYSVQSPLREAYLIAKR